MAVDQHLQGVNTTTTTYVILYYNNPVSIYWFYDNNWSQPRLFLLTL